MKLRSRAKKGRPPIPKSHKRYVLDLLRDGFKLREVSQITNYSLGSIYNIKKT